MLYDAHIILKNNEKDLKKWFFENFINELINNCYNNNIINLLFKYLNINKDLNIFIYLKKFNNFQILLSNVKYIIKDINSILNYLIKLKKLNLE